MKELSIEEKAKRYDEALKVLHKYDGANIMFSQSLKEEMFPELKESEDEKIRKAIISFLKSPFVNENITDEKVTPWLAWLEKQGEQKPNLCNGCINRKGCINCENGELREVEQKPTDKVKSKFKVRYAGSEYNVLEVKEIAGVTYYGIEDEPNHIDYVLPDNCEIVSEQKPTDIQSIEKRAYEVFPDDDDENTPFYRQAFIDGAVDYIDCGCKKSSAWSEEDDSNLQCCIAKVQNDIDNGRIGTNRELLAWLKSLKDRVLPQPKQEWSGGDEAHLHSIITHLKQWIERHPNTTGADIQGENITWLKLLRPQSTEVKDFWKSADGDDLPEIDREVIVLLKGGKVAFGHRPYKGKISGKNLTTGNIETFENQTYDKGGWNIPDVKYWLDVELPEGVE